MSTPLTPPIQTSRVLIFSDFNCPYCFTLNEWLAEEQLDGDVHWLGIEHRASLPRGGSNSASERRQLVEEVEDVKRRAPEVGVVAPSVWCSSHDALLLQNAAEVDYPETAATLRRRLFRAYWREDKLLSDPEWLQQAAASFPDVEPALEQEELERLTQWWATHLDRIPAMLAPTGVAHLGLQDKAAVVRFMRSALHETPAGPGCR